MFLSDEIIPALIDKQIALEGRLFVIGSNTRLKTAVGGLDVTVAVVNADDNGIVGSVVIHKIHSVSFLPLGGNAKNNGFGGGQFDHHQRKVASCQIDNLP